jgi:hypothetical protein
MQLNQLADELAVNVTVIKKWLRENGFSSADRDFTSAETTLIREEVRAIVGAKERGELKRARGRAVVVEAESDDYDAVSCADVGGLRRAEPCLSSGPAKSNAGHHVYVHADVLEWLGDRTTPIEQRRAFTRRTQEIMAHGRATQMKGVRGVNAGWLRTSLGGNGGFQFYLWLLNAGEKVRRQAEQAAALHAKTSPNARFLRSVRHHDETSDQLDVGVFEDYCELAPQTLVAAEDDGLVDPLVDAQRAIVADRTRVRVLVGQPGAGKTTSLQSAASRLDGRALYVTWSGLLASRAREWFAAFAPRELDVVVMTYQELLTRVAPQRTLERELSLNDAVQLLRERLEPYAGQLASWREDGQLRAEALYAELHAHVLGAALPVAFRGRGACGHAWLGDEDYRSLRGLLGPNAVKAALLARSKLSATDLARLFPGAIGAFERAHALKTGEIVLDPTEFAFDWVLVDEVQDLTLIEQWLLVDVTARSGAARGVNPGMVIAGDESQTVRPTAFAFAPLSNLIDERLGARTDRREHALEENLRSPEAVARTVGRLRDVLYAALPRSERPRGQRSDSPADVTLGRVMQVEVADDVAMRRVFERFASNRAEAALVFPGALVPHRLRALADELGVTVWTSETIKGLEFRIVGVLDVPAELERILALATNANREHLEVELARTAIDRFVVACSRSTETLVLIGKGWRDPRMSPLLLRLFEGETSEDVERSSGSDVAEGHLGVVAFEQLDAVLEIDAADAVFQVDSLIEQSERASQAGELEDALRLAENARGLVGSPGRPGAAGAERRVRAHRRLAQAMALLGLQRARPDVVGQSARVWHSAGDPGVGRAMTALAGMLTRQFTDTEACKRMAAVADALEAIAEREPTLLESVLAGLRDYAARAEKQRAMPAEPAGRDAALRALDRLARTAPSGRDAFRETHQAVLARVLGHVGQKPEKAYQREYASLREGLADAGALDLLDARHAEVCGDLAGALARWEALGRLKDALGCARALADFSAAARIAEAAGEPDAPRLAWARDLELVLTAEPEGALTEAELGRLRERADRVLGGVRGRRPRG